MYYFSLIICALSGVMYHISQKSIHAKASPLVSIIITYAVALFISLLMFFFDKNRAPFFTSLQDLNWASYALGITIVGIEIGFLLAYRNGWDIGTMNLAYMLILSAILVPLGMIFFKEEHTIRTFIGIGVSITGLLIMKI
jgi:drug/metabolite transporter (DMT)-like permease